MSKVLTGMRPRCVVALRCKKAGLLGWIATPNLFHGTMHGNPNRLRRKRRDVVRVKNALGEIPTRPTTLLDRQIGLVAKMRRDQRRSVEARLAHHHKRPICWN